MAATLDKPIPKTGLLSEERESRGFYPLVIRNVSLLKWTDDDFFQFCQDNQPWRIERTARGEIELMEPTGWESGAMSGEGLFQTKLWAREDGTGTSTDSSAGFTLPNGATRSPDAAWVSRSRLDLIPKEQRKKFLPLCPDFALEITSPTDSLIATQAKMREYIENGLRLGVLLHPAKRQVWVYRPNLDPEQFENPATVSCEPEMPGFTLNITAIFDADN